HFLERRFAGKQQLSANRRHSKDCAIVVAIRNCQPGKTYQRYISSNEESNSNAAYPSNSTNPANPERSISKDACSRRITASGNGQPCFRLGYGHSLQSCFCQLRLVRYLCWRQPWIWLGSI